MTIDYIEKYVIGYVIFVKIEYVHLLICYMIYNLDHAPNYLEKRTSAPLILKAHSRFLFFVLFCLVLI